ncbi:MAG: RsmE family RNA methyltransferase [Candidatus Acidiferrales bacterium]
MRRRFFVDKFEPNSATLRGQTAEHLGRVLRAEPNQLYELSDGHRVWLARLERVELPKRGESRIDFALVEPIDSREPRIRMILLLSIIKFDRFEWCLEKATELGVSEIVPLAASRSDRALVAAAEKRSARWEKILLESSQQSRRLRPPKLCARSAEERRGSAVQSVFTPPSAFTASSADCEIILSERPGTDLLRNVLPPRSSVEPPSAQSLSVALAIGPEGGWTDEELASARIAGFVKASLGENILRAETAVVAAMAILGFALG